MKHLLTLCFLLIATVSFAQDNTEDTTLYTDSKSDSYVRTDSNTTVNSPPPSAVAPSINSSNSDLCTVGVSGAVQTQILGLSAGKTVRDMNCEKLKNAKTMYDMGMKVAAVSVMCQDHRVFDAMMDAGTPCPYDGDIGEAAKMGWINDTASMPNGSKYKTTGETQTSQEKGILGNLDEDEKSTLFGGGAVGGLLLLLLL
jgi:hypothetical protein